MNKVYMSIRIIGIIIGLLFISCTKDNEKDKTLEAISIELISGGSQIGNIETALDNPVIILVKDQNRNGFQGINVNYNVTEGSVSSETTITDENGNAIVIWTLGATEGEQTLTITAYESDGTTELNGSPIVVTATANDELSNYQSFGSHTYAITKDYYSWNEAKQLAEKKGGYLVVIESQEENDFIQNTYRTPLNTEGNILWIGLSDQQEEGIFRWINGEIPVYTNWEEGEPNNTDGIQDYVHMYANGKWDDVDDITCLAIIEFED